jgi:outer membrane protein assembly complex protein YaeT
VAFFVLALGWTPLFSQEGSVVRSISFEGNATLADESLRKVMMTYETPWIEQQILGTEPYYFSAEVFRSDLENIVTTYQHEGFLDIKIDTAIVQTDEKSETSTILIRVREGVAFTVDSITVEAPGDSLWTAVFQETWASLSNDFALRAGARFRDDDVLSDKERLTTAFSDRGYAYVRTTAELKADTAHTAASVRWLIVPGPLCHYGEIKIIGNSRVKTSLIESKLPFAEGDTYSTSQMENAQREIYGLGQFQAVLFRPRLEGLEPRIPLTLVIQEASDLKAKFGVGYGAEERFRAFAEVKRLGFLGGARTLTLYAKYSSLTPVNTSLTFVQPDFVTPKLNLYIRPYILFENEVGYSVRRYGGDVTLERRFFMSLLTGLTYTLEQVQSTGDQAQVPENESTYNKSAIGLSLTLNNSSPLFDPVQGWLNSVRLFYTGLPPSPEIEFFRALYDVRHYGELSTNVVLATRLKVGSIWTRTAADFVPPEERFYAGGSYSVRGYSRNKLGPVDSEGNPIGGRSIIEASIEFRFSLVGSLGFVMFVDAGNVWEPTSTYKLDEVAYAAGAGFRYDTPVGPVRFDAAHSITDRGNPWEFHFSIGQAF